VNDHDDLSRQLRAALDEAAETTPRVDLATASLGQARRMRTRRRIAVVTASALVVAVVVPVSLRLGSDSTGQAHVASTGPSSGTGSDGTFATVPLRAPVVVGIDSGLTAGAVPHVPYVNGHLFHGPDTTATIVDTPLPIKDVAAFDDGIGVWTEDPRTDIKHFSTNGTASSLPTSATVSNPAIDAVTHAVAWAAHDVDAAGNPSSSDTLFYSTRLDAPEHALDTGPYVVRHVMGVSGGIVVMNAAKGPHDAVVDADVATGQLSVPWPQLRIATAVSPDLSQIAGELTSESANCSAMLDFRSGDEQWQSCTWRPMEFSPDGSRVLAFAADEATRVQDIAVLAAGTGDVIQSFTTRDIFGRATFETGTSIIFVIAWKGQSAIVRCDMSGSCENATAVADTGTGTTGSLLVPYQITAN
jgi:hypothetical protein